MCGSRAYKAATRTRGASVIGRVERAAPHSISRASGVVRTRYAAVAPPSAHRRRGPLNGCVASSEMPLGFPRPCAEGMPVGPLVPVRSSAGMAVTGTLSVHARVRALGHADSTRVGARGKSGLRYETARPTVVKGPCHTPCCAINHGLRTSLPHHARTADRKRVSTPAETWTVRVVPDRPAGARTRAWGLTGPDIPSYAPVPTFYA